MLLPTTVSALCDQMTASLRSAAEGFVRRFCPEDRLPAIVAGYRSYERTDSALLQLYARLLRLGIEQLNGRPLRQQLTAFLGQIRGEEYETWWSLFIAETLLATGPRLEGHPLLAGLGDAQRQQVREALDSSHVVDVPGRKLLGKPNNYWIVMARLEQVRLALGATQDDTIYRLALERSREVLCANPCGFLDDDQDGRGRYDIYSFGSLLHAEPLWRELPAEEIRRAIHAHGRLLLTLARPDGGSVAWGRSAELSLLTYLNFGSALLQHDRTAERPRLLGLMAHAFHQFGEHYWADDALTTHRGKMNHWYLGEFRLLETSLNALSLLAETVDRLRKVAKADPHLTAETRPAALWPEQDLWIPFDERGPGVWCYRQGDVAFQLPLVDGYTSDYAAFPVWPGFLEQPVDKGLACGVPNVFFKGKRYLPLRRPVEVRYRPGELSWVTDRFTWFEDFDWWKPNEDVPGRRAVTVRAVPGGLEILEEWTFDRVPEALGLQIAETRTPLEVAWECDHKHQAFVVGVEGMREWRSYWHEIKRVHQLDVVPARQVRLRYRITPARSGNP